METKKRSTKKTGSTKTRKTASKTPKTKRTTSSSRTASKSRTGTRKRRAISKNNTKLLIFLLIALICCITFIVINSLIPWVKSNNQNDETDSSDSQIVLDGPEAELLNEAIMNAAQQKPKPKDKTASKPEAKPSEKTETKPSEKPDSKPVDKPDAKPVDKPETKPAEKPDTKPAEKPETKPVEKPTQVSFNFPQAVNKAQIVFLLDDGGQNLSQLEKFTSLQMPLTIAVLPKLAHSKDAAQKVRASGKELLLHQPMQSVNSSVNPGPGAIKPQMSDAEIRALLAENFDEVGPIAGFNNHEGSAITADAHKMEVIMKYASDNGVFFLDSRTNKDTQVPYVCQALGYSYYERNGLFLDNKLTQAEKDQGLTMRTKALDLIRKNVDKANKEGVVIMIGHVWSADWLAQVLKDIYPELKAKGYTVTTVSKCKGKK